MTKLLPPEHLPPIVDQQSLERTWRVLMGKLGFAAPQLWVMLLPGGQAAHLSKIADVPLMPDPLGLAGLQKAFGSFIADPADVAFLYCRPGGPGWSEGDRAWAAGLSELFPGGWPVHLANDCVLRVAGPDDLVGLVRV